MFIKNLYLQNFKNIKELQLDFSSINLIEGNNGCGKSSILEALSYILCNDLSEKISEYVRKGSKEFILKSNFNHFGKDFNIEIIGGLKKTDKCLKVNNEEYKGSDVGKIMEEFINPTITKYSAISEQGKATQLLFEKPTERLRKFKEIFKIDKINDSVEKIKEDIKQNKDDADKINIEIKTLQGISFSFLNEIDYIDTQKLQNELKELEEQKILYEQNEKEKNDNLKNIVGLEKQKNSYQFEIDRNILNKTNVEKLETEKNQKQNELALIKIRRLEDINVKKNIIEQIRKQNEDLNLNIKTLKKEIDLAKQGKCPTCGKEYIIENLSDYELKLKNDIDAIRINSDEIKSLQKDVEEWNKLNIEQEKLLTKQELLKRDIVSIEEKILNINYLSENSLNDILNKLNDVKLKIEELKDKNNLFDKNEFNFKQHDDVKKKIIQAESSNGERLRIIEHNKKIQEEQILTNKKISDKQTEKENLQSRNKLLDECKDILDKNFSSYLIAKGTSYIQDKMNQFFKNTYGRYNICLEQDKNSINFFYTDNVNGLFPVSMASGFEKQLLSIANRVALCSLQNLGIMLLDEIDSDASLENSSNLFKVLFNEKNINQFFIISHHENTKEFIRNSFSNNKSFELDKGSLII